MHVDAKLTKTVDGIHAAESGPERRSRRRAELLEKLSAATGVGVEALATSLKDLATEGFDELVPLVADVDYGNQVIDEEDLSGTIYNMGTSLLSWVRDLLDADLFDTDARVLGLTSEGNQVAWRGESTLVQVGMYEKGKSPYGIYDVAGNVWEWVSDWYEVDYYSHSPTHNPQGPETGKDKALRSSGWQGETPQMRVFTRIKSVPTDRNDSTGFRCAQTISASATPK